MTAFARTRKATRYRSCDLGTLLRFAAQLVTSLCMRGISSLGGRTRKRVLVYISLSLYGFERLGLDGYWKPNLGSLEEWCMLLTSQPLLWPPV